MTDTDTASTITSNGVLDQRRAEALATRLRAAVRNGRNAITVALGADTVLASPSILGFMVRADAVLRRGGGRLELCADQAILDQLTALGIGGLRLAERSDAGTASAAPQ